MTVLAPVVVRAQSAPVSLESGGYMKWYAAAGYVKAKENKADYNRFDIMGDAEIYFSGESVLGEDEKYKIGVMAQLKTGTESTDSDDSGEYALYADTKEGRIWDEVYALFDAPFGRFFFRKREKCRLSNGCHGSDNQRFRGGRIGIYAFVGFRTDDDFTRL